MPDVLKHFGMSHLRLAVVGAVLASLVLGLGFVHSSFVQRHVLAWAVERLRTDAGIPAEAERLDYNLLTLRLSVWNATLTAVAAETPFFSVDALNVDLPWTILRGRIAIEVLEVDRPRLVVTRSAESVPNLSDPTASNDRVATPARLIAIDAGRGALALFVRNDVLGRVGGTAIPWQGVPCPPACPQDRRT